MHWLNGGDAKPTFTPPRPFEQGVARRPTLVDNVETLAHLALIARVGGAHWADASTTLVTVSGAVERPGVYEVPTGISLDAVLRNARQRPPVGVLVGGYFGTWLTPDRSGATRALDAGIVSRARRRRVPARGARTRRDLAREPDGRPMRTVRARASRPSPAPSTHLATGATRDAARARRPNVGARW